MTSHRTPLRTGLVLLASVVTLSAVLWSSHAALGSSGPAVVGPDPASGQALEFRVSGRRYAYDPPQIVVTQDDLVKIVFSCEDIAHSFTLDDYRISKRASPGQPVVFEFRADKPGRFPIYCALAIDEGCRQMRGELVVKPR